MMGEQIKNAFIFVTGAVIGSLVTWKLLEAKYKKIADEEIQSVKDAFVNSNNPDNNKVVDESKEKEDHEKTVKDDYSNIVQDLGYTTDEKKGGKSVMNDKPYVIRPEEFGENGDYETESLTYYSDGVLTDDFDNPINDVEFLVGEDSLTHFGEYEDDSVFVRNDATKSYYEILLDTRAYSTIQRQAILAVDDEQ